MRPIIDERANTPSRFAPRRLDFDHVRAHVGQKPRAEPAAIVRQIEHAQTRKRPIRFHAAHREAFAPHLPSPINRARTRATGQPFAMLKASRDGSTVAPQKSATVAQSDYKATLQLPKTDFPMKANLPKREPETLRRWEAERLYEQILAARREASTWILHDGPPYANGRVHLGTALNKVLKDFVVRSRSMLGYRTPFVPGWDCHGMPIEFKVARDLGERARSISKLELRRLCKAEAEKWIDLQRQDFKRLGCLGDWQHPYITMDPAYDAAEIGVLRTLVARGYVYRGLRPVHWCFYDRTALAEAEVEYREHTSPSIYVAFRLNDRATAPATLAADPAEGAELAAAHRAQKLFAVIWTTTPWTLPANLAITLNAAFDYVALKVGDRYYIVTARLAEAVAQACGLRVDKTIALDRDALRRL